MIMGALKTFSFLCFTFLNLLLLLDLTICMQATLEGMVRL
jgi:hypothetical protein